MSDYGMLLEELGLITSADVLVTAGGPYEDKEALERVRDMAKHNIKEREHQLAEYRKANPDSMDPRQRNSGEDKAGRDRREKEYAEQYRRESEVTKEEARRQDEEARERQRSERAAQPHPHAHHDAARDREKK